MPFLDWVNKNQAQQASREVPYHLLKQEAVYGDNAENLLIQGDNLLALKALIPFYAGRVKCIFIDPPYNTQSAFDHYDDKLEHSQWLSMMYPRLVLLRELLAEDGSIWVILDDSEMQYCKVLMDEIFGRSNYCNIVTTTTNDPSGFKATGATIFSTANHLLIYAKDKRTKPIKKTWIPKGYDSGYNKVLANKALPYDQWTWTNIQDATAIELGFTDTKKAKKELAETFEDEIAEFALRHADRVFQLVAIGGGAAIKRKATIEKSRSIRDKVLVHPDDDVDDFYMANGRQLVFYDKRLIEVDHQIVPGELVTDVWTDIAWNGIGPEGAVDFKNGKKPEELIKRVLEMATNVGDLVLDSFLGSGTTVAVAHKMQRHHIGIEMGEQILSHCIPRLRGVVEGEQSGISRVVSWQGGGGFRFCTLGETAFDEHGRINQAVRFSTLAAYVWHFETGEPGQQTFDQPLLGIHNDTAYYLLYNGILGDRRPASGNVLTHAVLQAVNEIFPHAGRKVIYGETTRLGAARLVAENITFKQIPYDVKMR
jgi:adenine-specific DNA-methyltransferase